MKKFNPYENAVLVAVGFSLLYVVLTIGICLII